jgi:outer membrane receptor protein involved in Fe transport
VKICVLFVLGTLLSFGQTAELKLEVVDASGGALVARGVVENQGAGVRRGFDTDSQGKAVLHGLPAGAYTLRVSREGFATHAATLQLARGAAVTHKVVLELGAAAYSVSVVSATPLAGLDRPVDEMPAPVKTATDKDIETSGAVDLSDFLNRRFSNVYLNEIQGNPMQPDLNYRGYTASPLLGTPQGISIYLDGVRLNQPFGDVVSWDLIPRVAVGEMALVPGSNPLFGLNTLGGAVSLRSKDGITHQGTSLTMRGGSFGRRMGDLEHGGAAANGLNWYLASTMFFEDGWREASPSNVRQFLGRLGVQKQRTAVSLMASFANNSLIGNGLQEQRFLLRDYRSSYTKPDQTANRSPFVNLNVRRSLTAKVSLAGNVYFRHIRTLTLNGDLNEGSLDQAVYQPGAAERAALAAAGYTGFPTAGANATNTPWPFWRCIANVLLKDEPGEKCNGLINRTGTQMRNYGFSTQGNWVTGRNQVTAGVAYDGNSVSFVQSTELGYLLPNRTVQGTGVFADGVNAGDVDGEPFDNRVRLSGRIHNTSFYVTDAVKVGARLNVTLSGRFNHTIVDNQDRIRPVAGTGSLTGRHVFNRFNPAIGATYRLGGGVNAYASFTEGNRAPTSIELGCADPAAPCRLPNSMAGDPPLEQVVTRTLEGGVRSGSESRVRWSAGWFRAVNTNDILFVASEQTGFGYFKNFGRTLRQGIELDSNTRVGRVTVGASYTWLRATYESEEVVNGAANSTNHQTERITIRPGNRIPLTPSHNMKAYADVRVTAKLLVDLNAIGVGRAFARGNENNLHQADGVYYLGPGYSAGYAVVNAGLRYRFTGMLEAFVQVNNVANRRYYTAAQLGPTGFTATGNFIARPFPVTAGGEYPVQKATFYAPGAPRAGFVGLKLRF